MEDEPGEPLGSPLSRNSGLVGPLPLTAMGAVSPEAPKSPVDPANQEEFDEFDDSALAGTYRCKCVDDSYQVWRWKISQWSQVHEHQTQIYSDRFEVGGHPWRLMLFPRGNQQTTNLSVYLEVADHKELKSPWVRKTKFMIGAVHPDDYRKSHQQDSSKLFKGNETDWGFRDFIPFEQLRRDGLVKGDTLVLEITLEVEKPAATLASATALVPKSSQDATSLAPLTPGLRDGIGYVGLKNQGATCYLNSLLQTLFHIPAFRRAVYRMPAAADDQTEKSVALALQRVFYQLQFSSHAVGTKQLTKSFGWDAADSFMQHDVQELARVLLDNLETKMKKTEVDGSVEKLFRGRMRNYIRCVNVPFESTRSEDFYDIQLNVKGCRTVIDSFKQYVEVEMLDGENMYHAEGHGKQPAKKGVIFEYFPQVLMLHLKRFSYDFQTDRLFKINDRLEFPVELDLTEFQLPSADVSDPPVYQLHSILVHSGDVHGGHYYAFVRPGQDPQWFKFDDDVVSAASSSEAIDENFGMDKEKPSKLGGMAKTRRFQSHNVFRRFANAYMLVYVRNSAECNVMQPVDVSEIPVHLKQRFDEELHDEDQKRIEREQAYMMASLRICARVDLQRHCKLDLIDQSAIDLIRIKRDAPFSELKRMLEAKYGIPACCQRFWKFDLRQNGTNRPDNCLIVQDDSRQIDKIFKLPGLTSGTISSYNFGSFGTTGYEQMDAARIYFLENAAENGFDESVVDASGAVLPASAIPGIPKGSDNMMLFFKVYDPAQKIAAMVREMMVSDSETFETLSPRLCALVGWDPSTPLLIFEELKPDRVELIPKGKRLLECELQTGDILVFQKALTAEEAGEFEFPTAQLFLQFLSSKVEIKVIPKDQPDVVTGDSVVDFSGSRHMTYDEFSRRIGEALNVHGDHLRFFGHSDRGPRRDAFSSHTKTLRDMLLMRTSRDDMMAGCIYYEMLDLPLREFEVKRVLNVQLFDQETWTFKDLRLVIPRTDIVADVLGMVAQQEQISQERLRLVQTGSSRISAIINDSDKVDTLYDFQMTQYRIDALPADAEQLDEATQRLASVASAERHGASFKHHGAPFLFLIDMHTTARDLVAYLGQKLHLAEEEWSKWKVLVPAGVGASHAAVLLPEAPLMASCKMDVNLLYQSHLLIERKDLDPKKSASTGGLRSLERDIKIYN